MTMDNKKIMSNIYLSLCNDRGGLAVQPEPDNVFHLPGKVLDFLWILLTE